MLVCFLYHLYLVFHLKVLKIMFSNSWLFPHADDPFLRAAPSKLAECRSRVGLWRHVELHPPVRGGIAAAYHAAEVLVGAKGVVGHVLCLWLNVVVGCVGVRCRILVLYDSSCRINIIFFESTPTIYSLLFTFIFFHLDNFNFFYPNTTLNIKKFQLKYLKF